MGALTATLLRELVNYDPETGIFTGRIWRGKIAIGSIIGNTNAVTGYHVIQIYGAKYGAHRLAWLYMTGKEPTNHIDHKNCIRNDNRFDNLREATRLQNGRNMRTPKSNTSGLKGVHPYKGGPRWRATIKREGRCHHLGLFDTASDAHAAYCAATMKFDPHFARFA